ncbi:proline dehydrogenase family protein [Parenemella sanctibonifatiensis]|uniref:L-glutamate gamma-semialdehyde dehydrogenase n=1 Tax=Parenemella sanctibonifatiensis TaxID=2016505 RepID=A0A255EHY5_9ACTN|nr:proline dehydrogenase family protein [Parenemella sanctibonifatiensis]OYN90860.1 1-pyrroline-5-carboxylate dehydrogenase [Parenemella sanctibonifatiensis]
MVDATYVSSYPHPAELADDAVELVRRWLVESEGSQATGRAAMAADLLAGVLAHPSGLPFTMGFVDRVVRPEDPVTAAAQFAELARMDLDFLPAPLAKLVRLGGAVASRAPHQVVPIARRVLRELVGHLVLDSRPHALKRSLAHLRRDGVRVNLNLLGEAVLGQDEADRRLAGTLELLRRPDVDYVSIKVSSVVPHLNLWAFEQTVAAVVERLTPLYREAAQARDSSAAGPTFINLDMEEYHDLDLTLAVFMTLLDQPELRGLEAGIVLQAYLPDSLAALQRLTDWAQRRLDAGGAGIKVRLVKGANLPMERVDAELHGWELATWPSKVETDRQYKRVLDWALTPERTRAVRVGVAGHNLFDLALAHLLSEARGVADRVEFEMLLGMSPDQVEVIRRTVGGLLLYTPVVHPAHFDTAISYLVRRLEENSASDNFMSAVTEIGSDQSLFAREEDRFRSALQGLDRRTPSPRRRQDSARHPVVVPGGDRGFSSATDSDPSLRSTRSWARSLTDQIRRDVSAPTATGLGQDTLAGSQCANPAAVIAVLARARAAQPGWHDLGANGRAEVLRRAAVELSGRRGDLVVVAAAETGKVIAEGDVEVSEAVDFANWYADQAIALEQVAGAEPVPPQVTVATPPWNFPLAITAGSVLAPLAVGSATVLKPAPQARRCAAVIAECLWAAGVPTDVLQLADAGEGEAGRALICHPDVDLVLLTGAHATAELFHGWRADLRLYAETSGKNAIIVTPSADYDLAAADIVRSAFGHAGQKCSAASLVILVGQAARSTRLRDQILDGARSLRVGWPTDPRAEVGPVIEPVGGKLLSGLTDLAEGESWALRPRQLDGTGRLWSPGVRAGVQPGAAFHRTECFGPVTGIMEAASLGEAIAWQNSTPYGLTAGLHSQNPTEIEAWLSGVEAGNLYVNRGITGAIVGRQPFGGWKQSVVGPGAKAGGPNHLASLVRWAPMGRPRRAAASSAVTLTEPVQKLLARWAEDPDLSADLAALRLAAESDDLAWRDHFSPRDVTGLAAEANVLRHLPAAVTVRAADGAELGDLLRVALAAVRAGATVDYSVADESLAAALRAAGTVRVESDQAATRTTRCRLRLVGATPQTPRPNSVDVAVWDGPVTLAGRVELLPFLQEQAVSLTAHRFGNPDPVLQQVRERLAQG